MPGEVAASEAAVRGTWVLAASSGKQVLAVAPREASGENSLRQASISARCSPTGHCSIQSCSSRVLTQFCSCGAPGSGSR